MSTEPEPTTVEVEAPTAAESEAQREADLAEAMAAREEAEAAAEAERQAMAEAATSHIGQPEEPDATPRIEDGESAAETGGNDTSVEAKDEAEAKQAAKRSEQGKHPTAKK